MDVRTHATATTPDTPPWRSEIASPVQRWCMRREPATALDVGLRCRCSNQFQAASPFISPRRSTNPPVRPIALSFFFSFFPFPSSLQPSGARCPPAASRSIARSHPSFVSIVTVRHPPDSLSPQRDNCLPCKRHVISYRERTAGGCLAWLNEECTRQKFSCRSLVLCIAKAGLPLYPPSEAATADGVLTRRGDPGGSVRRYRNRYSQDCTV